MVGLKYWLLQLKTPFNVILSLHWILRHVRVTLSPYHLPTMLWDRASGNVFKYAFVWCLHTQKIKDKKIKIAIMECSLGSYYRMFLYHHPPCWVQTQTHMQSSARVPLRWISIHKSKDFSTHPTIQRGGRSGMGPTIMTAPIRRDQERRRKSSTDWMMGKRKDLLSGERGQKNSAPLDCFNPLIWQHLTLEIQGMR